MKEKNQETLRFIEKGSRFHNNKFNYEKTVYKGSAQPIIVTCPIHGDYIYHEPATIYDLAVVPAVFFRPTRKDVTQLKIG